MSYFESKRSHEEKAERKATRELQRRRKQIQIPLFNGDFDPDTYLDWEKEMDLIIKCQGYTAEKQAQLASTGLCGYALDWWYQTANTRRQYGEQQISSWYEMKAVMKKRFVAKRYGQTDFERMQFQAREAKGCVRKSKDEPKSYCGHEEQRKLQLHNAYLDELQSPQFKEHLMKIIDKSLTSVIKNTHQRSVPRPASRADELGCYQNEPAEKKEETAAKQGEREQYFESEPTILCEADNLENTLKEEKRLSARCSHVPDQTNKEEGVLEESSTAPDLELVLVDQGESIKTLTCDLLTRSMVYFQFSFVDHLRVPKGLQQIVFEPGGNLCLHQSINNNLIQKAAAVKLDLEGLLHEQEEPTSVSGFSKVISLAKKSSIKAFSGYQWREAQSEAVRSELNKEQKLLALCVACKKHCPVKHLERVKALQSFVFEPGGEINVHKSIINTLVQEETKKLRLDSTFILKEQDLRTNLFKGGGNGATWSSFKLMFWKLIHVPERKWVIARPSGLIGELIGLIHEVLDREKSIGLDEAFKEKGVTMDQHGRLVCNVIDQEMDGRKLDRQEMKWEICYDQEMHCSNRHGREMSWKWKMKNKSWKGNMMRIFIIQMSIRSSLVGPGTRWIEPKKDLFEKGLYRPKKWKDKPAWFIIGPI